MEQQRYSLRTNIGFMLNKPIGFSRDFHLEYEEIFLPPDLNVKDLACQYRLSRTSEGLLFQGNLQGKIEMDCARCLETNWMPVNAEIDEIFFFPDKVKDDSEQMIPEDGYIDLAETFREFLLLELPITPVCSPDCKGVCIECGQNLNKGSCEHSDSRIDFS